tara:strand:+ start:19531 stop:21933 length:2403 start_codon:yes stop_codon:yes gene_type:complete
MADFSLSPGIVTREFDNSLTTVTVPQLSVGGVVGRYSWGPAMIPTMVASETELALEFGKPESDNYIEWFNGKNFLDYATSLNVVRMVDSANTKNATFSGTAVLVTNDESYNDSLLISEGGLSDGTGGGSIFGSTSTHGPWIAKFPGTLGNTLKVDMCFATERAHAQGLANTANDNLNQIELTPISGNKYTVRFANNNGVANTYYNFMDGANGYFTEDDIMTQQKVITFDFNSKEYNMLFQSMDTGAKTAVAWVNVGTHTAPPAVEYSASAFVTQITVRERSKFAEFASGARRNSPKNLMGMVYFTNNTNVLYGSGTVFTKQVSVGDHITVDGQTSRVTQVVSDTQLKLNGSLVGSYTSDTPVSWSRKWRYADSFTAEPATSTSIRTLNGNPTGDYNDQMHLVVLDEQGMITGRMNEVIESYAFLSLAKDGTDDFGVPTYYVSRINTNSSWVRWAIHPVTTSNWGSTALGTVFGTYNNTLGSAASDASVSSFTGGVNGSAMGTADVIAAVELFRAKETYELDFFLTGWTYNSAAPINYQLAISKMIQVAEDRKDCVVCVSPEYNTVARGISNPETITDNLITWRESVYSSSYAIMDGNFKYQYDQYADTYRWLPLSGDIGGLMARTDENFKPWFSPAGAVRGVIKNVVKLAYNPSQAQRDELYVSQVNPVITFRGEGTMLYGDKTLQNFASAFDRINVRRLFITLKEFVVAQARRRLFEFNTPSTRAEFARVTEAYLETVVTEQGASDFRVVCSEVNNTDLLIEQNKFVADIYIKPTYVINFIQLNFTAVGQSVEFSDLGV